MKRVFVRNRIILEGLNTWCVPRANSLNSTGSSLYQAFWCKCKKYKNSIHTKSTAVTDTCKLKVERFKLWWIYYHSNVYKTTSIMERMLAWCLHGLGRAWGAVVAQWIRPRTLNHEVPGSNLLAAAVVPLGKALYPHCLVPQKGLKAGGPLVACL